MIDLHTHILPHMDDGAGSVEESLQMLRMQRQQGVSTVVLTPHFYRDRERPERFFRRRRESFQLLQAKIGSLPEEERSTLPRMLLGAEVAWRPNLHGWDELPEFCLPGTKRLLLELPFAPWSQTLINQLCDMENRTGVTPIFAHLERYLPMQRRQAVEDLMSLGYPVQISGEPLLHFASRGKSLRLLKSAPVFVLASDCHGVDRRMPNLGPAMDTVRRRAGSSFAESLIERAEHLVESSH